MSMRIRINGVLHIGKRQKDGSIKYTPPLPESWTSRSKLKELIDSGRGPAVRTGSTFHAGRGSLVDQLGGDEEWAKTIDREYRKRTGMSLGSNDVYLSQLARFPGDPEAVFKPYDDYSSMQKTLKKRRSESENYEPPALAEDLVQEEVERSIKQGDDSPVEEIRERVIQKHGAKY